MWPSWLQPRGVGQTRSFGHGQGIQLGAQADAAAGTRAGALAAQQRDDARAADASTDLEAQILEQTGHKGGGPVFLKARLGVAVQGVKPSHRAAFVIAIPATEHAAPPGCISI